MLQPLIPVALALAVGAPTISWLARKMLFPAPQGSGTSPAAGRRDVTSITLPSGVEAWYLPPSHRALGDTGSPALVYTHGNGELIDDWIDEFEAPRRWGMGVLLVEYPGYGRSPGSPSEGSVEATMVQAHDWLLDHDDIDAERVVLLGRSLGGGAACTLARRRPVAALILESTFSSVELIARDMLVPGFLIRDPFDNLSTVEKFPGPILGFHGTEDRVIPYKHAKLLEAAHPNYELLTKKCGHNSCGRDWASIERFLRENGLLEGGSPPKRPSSAPTNL